MHNKDHSTLIRISEILSLAEFLSVELVSVRNTEPVYPVTTGEKLVCYALDILLMYEWASNDIEDLVDPIANDLQQLDTGVDKPAVWNSLFSKNNSLKQYLDNSHL